MTFSNACVTCQHIASPQTDGERHWWVCLNCGPCVVASECIACRNTGGVPLPSHPRPSTTKLVGDGSMAGEERFVCDEHAEEYLTTFAKYWSDPLAEAQKRGAAELHSRSRKAWVFLLGVLLGVVARELLRLL